MGYARAARLVDIMEQHGFVSGFDGSTPRKVLINEEGYCKFFGKNDANSRKDLTDKTFLVESDIEAPFLRWA